MDDLEWLNQFKEMYRERYPSAVANSYLDSIAEKLLKLDTGRKLIAKTVATLMEPPVSQRQCISIVNELTVFLGESK
jgi:hypothetical protein